MLMALLLGLALNGLAAAPAVAPGLDIAARHVLRLGIALLGMRISAALLEDLTPGLLGLVVGAVAATLAAGWALARALGLRGRFGVLTGGAVAICGASAAVAIAAVLPRDARAERDLALTVLAVTVLSTVAMVLYPALGPALGLEGAALGVFLGATIHDVAQVVGAGFSVSPETGKLAIMVKLVRVTLLAPVVLALALLLRGRTEGAARPPLLPGFIAVFLLLAVLGVAGLLPAQVIAAGSAVSGFALLLAVAAVGMKTSFARLAELGPRPVLLILAETAFLAVVVSGGLALAAG